jgi:hypothetical protein
MNDNKEQIELLQESIKTLEFMKKVWKDIKFYKFKAPPYTFYNIDEFIQKGSTGNYINLFYKKNLSSDDIQYLKCCIFEAGIFYAYENREVFDFVTRPKGVDGTIEQTKKIKEKIDELKKASNSLAG